MSDRGFEAIEPGSTRGWKSPWRSGVKSAARTSDPLVEAAAKWFKEAMTAWSEDDPVKVAALAPMSVEHLGKAVLWQANPTLLLPLSSDAEASLFILSTQPDLTNPKLRTIGLKDVLRRTEQILGGLPIDPSRCRRMVAVRNGAMHVGLPDESRHVLLDVLAVCRALLDALNRDADDFYGDHAQSVRKLLDEQSTEVGHRVTAKRAGARRKLRELEERLGDVFLETTTQLEQRAEYDLDPRNFGHDYWGVDATCPECGSQGRLIGRIDVDLDVDYDISETANMEPGIEAISSPTWELYPRVFACNVCRLTLTGPDELAEASLPSTRHEVEEDDLGPDFDPSIAFDYEDGYDM